MLVVTVPKSAGQAFARLPALARFLLVLTAVNVAMYAALRGCFWAVFYEASADASWADVATALYLGLKFDVRLALFLCLPLALLGWIRFFDPTRGRLARTAWIGYFTAAQSIVLLLYVVDIGHYGYLRVRLNATLFEHLTPVTVAAQMAWETYPVLLVLAGLLLLSFGYAWIVRNAARRTLAPVAEPIGAWWKRAALAGLAALYFLGMWGAWSWYPLRWSVAYFSANGAVAALALNPILFLADTAPSRGRLYDTSKVRAHYTHVASLLGIKEPRPESLDFTRYVTPASHPPARYNLVVIHMESLAAFKTGVFGNPLNATPHFDRIAQDGILFTNFFVPQFSTARSVFAMITGIPDLSPNRTASRDPLVVHQHSLVTALAGYEKFYFLGGSATWGNIRGLLAHNIPDLRMFEEGDYDAPRVDAWGVPDTVLFEKAHQIFNSAKGPFFAFVQTSGNHRPYTIPKDRTGFELAEMDSAALRANGFDSLAAYNGLRFLDHSLESFFKLARSSPYYRNTIFALYGDHGVVTPTPTAWQKLGLNLHHVPLVIYAPGLITEGHRIDFTASLPDTLPTLLGLLGVPHLNTGIGRDLLALGPADPHFALIQETGLLDDEFFLRLHPDGAHLYRYRSEAAAEDVHERYPAKVAELRQLHAALYETSRYLRYHNPARAHAPEGSMVRRSGVQ
ncbi:MAG: LTA synthase family protein [Burkholderiales bacterium]